MHNKFSCLSLATLILASENNLFFCRNYLKKAFLVTKTGYCVTYHLDIFSEGLQKRLHGNLGPLFWSSSRSTSYYSQRDISGTGRMQQKLQNTNVKQPKRCYTQEARQPPPSSPFALSHPQTKPVSPYWSVMCCASLSAKTSLVIWRYHVIMKLQEIKWMLTLLIVRHITFLPFVYFPDVLSGRTKMWRCYMTPAGHHLLYVFNKNNIPCHLKVLCNY